MGLGAAITAAAIDIGVGAATAGVIGTVAAGAIVGAGIGTVTSVITGGDIGKGALFGAVGGAVTGGVGSAIGDGASAAAEGAADTANAGADTAAAGGDVATTAGTDAGAVTGAADTTGTVSTAAGATDPTVTGVAAPTATGGAIDPNAAVNGVASPTGTAAITTPTAPAGATSTALSASPSGMLGDASLAGGDSTGAALENASNTINSWDNGSGSILGKNGWIEQNPTIAKIGAQAVGGVAQGLLSENQQSNLIKAYTANQQNQQNFVSGNYAQPAGGTPGTGGSAFTGVFTPQPASTSAAPPTTFTPSAYGGQWVYSPAAGKVIYQTNPAPSGG